MNARARDQTCARPYLLLAASRGRENGGSNPVVMQIYGSRPRDGQGIPPQTGLQILEITILQELQLCDSVFGFCNFVDAGCCCGNTCTGRISRFR